MRLESRWHPRALAARGRAWWRALFRRAELDQALEEEMRFHLEMEIEQNLRAGMTPDEARRVAAVAFGGQTSVMEAHRVARGTRLLDESLTDVRFALRTLARAPVFVVVSVLTLATAIAIGTALYTAVNGFVFRPLAVPNGERLVAVFTSDYSGPRFGSSSLADITAFTDAASPVAQVAGATRVMLALGEGDRTAYVQGSIVSPGYFEVLGVTAAIGAFPSAAPLDAPSIVLSHARWRLSFDGDSSVVGRPMRVNGQMFTVVAVARPEFRGLSREFADDFWVSTEFAPLVWARGAFLTERTARRWRTMARLHEGVTIDALQARLDALAFRLAQDEPDAWRDVNNDGRRITAIREHEAHLASIPRGQLLLLVGGVLALGLGLLAIASANLASLQVARGAARRREIATRLALGASRARLVRQLLIESALVIVPGVILGVLIAVVGAQFVANYRLLPLPTLDLSLDWRALLVLGSGLSLAMLVLGLMPALQSVRSDLLTDLKGGGQPGAAGIRIGGLRGALVITQVALSVVFTAVSGTVAMALSEYAERGREAASEVLLAHVNFLPAAGDARAVRALTERLVADAATIPGVSAAGAADFVPARGTRRTVSAEVRTANNATRELELDANGVSEGYFAAMGLPMLRGRGFTAGDADAVGSAVVLSRAMAEALWPAEDPVGRTIEITLRSRPQSATVIGVVADPVGEEPATQESFPGRLYLPVTYYDEGELVLLLRAPTAPAAVAAELVQRLRAENLRLVSRAVITLDEHHDRVVLPQRLLAQTTGVLAILQALLAIAGLAGLVAYVTTLRQREIGIRLALGARSGSVLKLVMRQGLQLTTIGCVVGLGLSAMAGRIIAATLPVTLPSTVIALTMAVVAFAATSAVAMLIPALRAVRVQPADALRLD